MRVTTAERLGLLAWVVGALVAAYLTWEHFTHNATLACSDRGLVNCASVTTSSYSTLFGMPVAVLGLAWFLVTLVAWWVLRPRLDPVVLQRLVVAGSGVGTAFVLWLVWAELVGVGHICLWCTVIHVVVVAVFVGSLVRLPVVSGRSRSSSQCAVTTHR